MSVLSMIDVFKGFSIDEKMAFIDQLSAAMADEKKRVGNQVDDVRAAANDPNQRLMLHQVHATAARFGVTIPENRKLSVYEVDKALRESGRNLTIEDRIAFKTMLAKAGVIQ